VASATRSLRCYCLTSWLADLKVEGEAVKVVKCLACLATRLSASNRHSVGLLQVVAEGAHGVGDDRSGTHRMLVVPGRGFGEGITTSSGGGPQMMDAGGVDGKRRSNTADAPTVSSEMDITLDNSIHHVKETLELDERVGVGWCRVQRRLAFCLLLRDRLIDR
jgi:hypothetical protein